MGQRRTRNGDHDECSRRSAFPVIREAVASFPDREHFRNAVSALLAAGFEPSDLSVLASHEALSTAAEKPGGLIAAGLSDELKYIAPLDRRRHRPRYRADRSP